MSLKETLSTYWVHLQAALLPWLDEAPDGPLTPRHKQLVAVLGLIRIEALLPSWPVLVGRPPAERAALARAFVAKAVFNVSEATAPYPGCLTLGRFLQWPSATA